MKAAAFLLTANFATAALPVSDIKREAPVEFAREIYPVLKRNCLACHNATKAKAGLNLETPETIQKGGENGPAAVAGRGMDSLVLKFAAHMDDEAMPPPDNKVNAVNLTTDELGLLKLWIDQGMKGTAPANVAAVTWRGVSGRVLPVTAVALSPGGTIAAAARGNQVNLLDVHTGTSLGSLADPELAKLDLYKDRPAADRDAVMAIAFGGDDLLATGGYRTVRLWRRAPLTQRESATLADAPLCLAASGKWAAAGDGAGRVWLWDTSAEKPPAKELKEHMTPVRALAMSPDGRWIVSVAEDRSVRVWSVEDGTVVSRSESPVPLAGLCFLKDGALLAAAGTDGMLRVYSFPGEAPPVVSAPPAPPKPVGEFRLTDKAPAIFTAMEKSGTQIVWGGGDALLHVFDAESGKGVRDVTCEHSLARSVLSAERLVQSSQRHADARKTRAAAATEAANKEGETVKAAHEAMEKARADWQRKQDAARVAGDALLALPEDKGRKDAAEKSGKEAAAAERAFINARTNAELSVRLAGQAQQARVAADAALIASQTALTETQANLESTKKAVATPFPAVKSAAVCAEGRTVLLSLDGGRAQWHSLESGALCDAAELPGSPLLAAAAGEQFVTTRSDKQSAVLPQRRGWKLERTIGNVDDATIFADRIMALSFSSDARLLATGGGVPSRGGEVKIWNTPDGLPVLTLKDPHSDTVNAITFSPDDSLLATAGSDRWARVFRVSDGQRTAAFEGHSSHVLSIAWRSDGLALATGSTDKTLRVWDVLESKQSRNNTSFGKEVSAVTWLGSGETIASASGDSTVRLNDDRLPGAKGFAFCLGTDLSGKLLAAGGEDGVLRLWSTAEKKLLWERPAP